MDNNTEKKRIIEKLFREHDASDAELAMLLSPDEGQNKQREHDASDREQAMRFAADRVQSGSGEEYTGLEGRSGPEECSSSENEQAGSENPASILPGSNATFGKNSRAGLSEADSQLFRCAREIAHKTFGNKIFVRGLIEFSNICGRNCYYCGLRRDNQATDRYRLTEEDILACCSTGYGLGFRTFVLQSGEDAFYTDDMICSIVRSIKSAYPDCAVTLSIGEKSADSYQKYFEAGADRYLLRQETASPELYARIHPEEMSWEHRMRCLKDLKRIGYQTGTGVMIGAPGQTAEDLVRDIRFMQELQPHMIGIGPFIPCTSTPYENRPAGSAALTLRMLGILRLIFPTVLLPATTALGTLDPGGREKGILAGANVLMPNLSPADARKKYLLYDNKICTGEEAAECRGCLDSRVAMIGYEIVTDRGDHPGFA